MKSKSFLKSDGDNENHLTVLGKESEKGDAVVSTGDRIRVNIITQPGSEEHMGSNVLVKWTVSDVRTTGVIGKGEFVVGA